MGVLELSREGAVAGASVRATAALVVADAAGACSSSAVPARVAALADGVTFAMLVTKSKVATALVLLVGLLAAGAGLLLAQAPGGEAKPDTKAAPDRPVAKKADADKRFEMRGRVVDPDGQPVNGAKVYRVVSRRLDYERGVEPKLLAQTGRDGAFQVRRPDRDGEGSTTWMAVATGFGPAVVEARAVLAADAITFRLVKDVPIVGRIVSLEGRPVAGVTVQAFVLYRTEKEDLEPWIKAVRDRKRMRLEDHFPLSVVGTTGIPGLPARQLTDADGRFRLTGVGRERLVALSVGGPKVEQDLILVMTRAGKAFRVPDAPESEYEHRVYPATFQHAASPPRPLVGTVRDSQTGKPIAGARIDADLEPVLDVRTKEDGTFRIDSLPAQAFHPAAGGSLELLAIGPADQAYLPALKELRRGARSEPLRADFALVRGVWAEGRVTNKRTGKPVRAGIEYYVAERNPAVKGYPDLPNRRRNALYLFHTKADGSFRIPVLPGPGAIGVQASAGKYLRGGSLTEAQHRQLLLPFPGYLGNFNATALIEGKSGEAVKCDLTVDPGETLTCRILDPEGKPVTSAFVHGYSPLQFWTVRPLGGSGFTLEALRPKQPHWVLVLHPGRQLGASVSLSAGQAGDREPVAIRLGRTGTITGRVLDPDGEPMKRQNLRVFYYKRDGILNEHLPHVVRTDDEGRFRVEGVIPGLLYQVDLAGKPPRSTIGSVKVDLTVEPGEVKDLGDVKARLFRD
jgi:protocatechuate 3,4-dioxygenase beta subunit